MYVLSNTYYFVNETYAKNIFLSLIKIKTTTKCINKKRVRIVTRFVYYVVIIM